MLLTNPTRGTPGTANRGIYTGSLFAPYIAAGTVLTRDVRGAAMPLDPNSAALAAWMHDHLNAGAGFGGTGFNTTERNTVPIAVYVVDSTAPDCEWQYVDAAAAGAGQDQEMVTQYCQGMIPLPHWVPEPWQGDRSIALYDLGTGIMREYFTFLKVPGKPGHWTCGVAGVSLARPGLVGLAETNPGMQTQAGQSAAVAMHNALGFIGVAELMQGTINHAIAFTCANMGRGISWPARSSDGTSTDTDAPVEGQWCRLPATVDPLHNPDTGLPYNRLTQVIITAFQRYGGFASDKNLFVHAFNGENGEQHRHLWGVDPWAEGEFLQRRYGGTIATGSTTGFNVADFPWHLTEWAPRDWGRPSPDFWLRPWQHAPWVG